MNCADCNGPIRQDDGPPEGWQLEDGRTVCHACCVADTTKIIRMVVDTMMEIRESGCKVCGNTPDDSGTIEHGRGCYVVSEDGGGESCA